MTFEQRIAQLERKIEKANKDLHEIEKWDGIGTKYSNKEMQINEYEHLIEWYKEKIAERNKWSERTFCQVHGCKNLMYDKCFVCKTPQNNSCEWLDNDERN